MVDNRREFDDLLQSVWQRRDRGMPVPPSALNRPVTHKDVEFLVNQYPFLQLISTNPEMANVMNPKFITALSGWVIHDYGIALSSSPGNYLLGGYAPLYAKISEDEEGGGSARGLEPGKGTVVNQTVVTAAQMIALAIEKGWPGVEIVDGTYLMKLAAWMAAEDREYKLTGFEAKEKDKAKRERIRRLIKPIGITPTMAPGRKF
ncbi:MAG: hypothetical protein WBE18_03095 [Gammaproteobacteria bacterium]